MISTSKIINNGYPLFSYIRKSNLYFIFIYFTNKSRRFYHVTASRITKKRPISLKQTIEYLRLENIHSIHIKSYHKLIKSNLSLKDEQILHDLFSNKILNIDLSISNLNKVNLFEEKRKLLENKICKYCKTKYRAIYLTSKFCSQTCSGQYKREQYKNKDKIFQEFDKAAGEYEDRIEMLYQY